MSVRKKERREDGEEGPGISDLDAPGHESSSEILTQERLQRGEWARWAWGLPSGAKR